MFKFLKDKLKNAIGKFSKDVEEEIKPEDIEEGAEDKTEEPEKGRPLKETEPDKEKIEETEEEPEQESSEPVEKEPEEPPKETEPEKKAEPEKEPEEEPATKEEKAEPEEPVEEDEDISIEPDTLSKPPVLKETIPDEEEHHDDSDLDYEPKVNKGFFSRMKDKVFKPAESEQAESEEKVTIKETEQPDDSAEETQEVEEKAEEQAEVKAEEKLKEDKPKKSIFSKLKDSVTKKSLSEDKFNDMFWELEVALLENNVAVQVIEKIKSDLRGELVDSKVPFGKAQDVIIESLSRSVEGLFDVASVDVLGEARKKKPYTILFVGVNGVGKTTSIAKLAHLLNENGLKCVMAAGDTFRAAAIQQLEEHAKKLNVKLIKHDYGSDPAAVAFDAKKYADAKGMDVVLIDSAGRQHSNSNLMEEMKKMVRVAEPDLKIFVGESITGNDCVEQANSFNETVGIDGIILSKADVDEKGGAAISVSYVTKKPILYLGTGQGYGDLQTFDKQQILKNIGLN